MEIRNSMDRKCHGLKITEQRTQAFIQNTAQRNKGEYEQVNKIIEHMNNMNNMNKIIEHKMYIYMEGLTYTHSFLQKENMREREGQYSKR